MIIYVMLSDVKNNNRNRNRFSHKIFDKTTRAVYMNAQVVGRMMCVFADRKGCSVRTRELSDEWGG